MARAKYSSGTNTDDAGVRAPIWELTPTSSVVNVCIYCKPLWPYPQQPYVNTFDNRETCRPIWSGAEKQNIVLFTVHVMYAVAYVSIIKECYVMLCYVMLCHITFMVFSKTNKNR